MGRIATRTLVFVFAFVVTQAVSAQKVIGDAAKELADQISTAATKQGKHKIAVIPFRELDGRSTVLGTYLAEELVTDLFASGTLDIVERSMLDKVMSELKFSQSGAIDPESAQHVGKIIGVEAIVTGSITDLQSYVGVNCRLINTETGRIFGAAQTKIVKDADLQKILEKSTSNEAPAPPASRSTPAPPSAAPSMQKTVASILFQLVGCKAAGDGVSCDLILTNVGQEDIHCYLNLRNGDRSSVLIDDQSNEYRSSGGSLGLLSSDNDAYLENTLVPGIPLKASVRFAGIPETVSGIRLLRISAGGGVKADFRDLPLTR